MKTEPARILINLGCGPRARPTSWLDYDGSWNVRASHLPLGLGWLGRKFLGHQGQGFPPHVRYLNAVKKLPFKDQSADGIYFSHLLEHLYLDQGRQLLSESFRVLKPGGVVRILVPDLEAFARQYVAAKNRHDEKACLHLNEMLMLRPMSGRMDLVRKVYTALTDFHSHKFMYDAAYLGLLLQQAGFSAITTVAYKESRIPEVAEIEHEERIAPGIGFGVEAVRPA